MQYAGILFSKYYNIRGIDSLNINNNGQNLFRPLYV